MASTQMKKPEKVLSARDVAAHLGCTPDTIYQLIKAGELRAFHVGRLVRIPESSLRDFIDNRATQ